MTEPKPLYWTNEKPEPLKFLAEIIRVQTMESNAIRVTMELSESETVLMAHLAECRRRGALLDIVAIPKIIEQVKESYGL